MCPEPERQAQQLTRNVVSKKVIALCKAASRVRGGSWIEGAPTHILAEMLSALERDGWGLARVGCPDEGRDPAKAWREQRAKLWAYRKPDGSSGPGLDDAIAYCDQKISEADAALGAASPDEEKPGLDYRGIGAQRWAGETVGIAYCPEHGLHGARETCFECGKPCEQVPMRVAGPADEGLRAALEGVARQVRPVDSDMVVQPVSAVAPVAVGRVGDKDPT